MAATQTTKPYVRMTTAGDILTGVHCIKSIVWIATTAGDDLILDDSNDDIVVEIKASVNNETIQIDVREEVQNLTVRTIDSGSVIVYR